ncbi:hypothetical protein CEP52_017836, partial [Fusarium oligoseptatum]
VVLNDLGLRFISHGGWDTLRKQGKYRGRVCDMSRFWLAIRSGNRRQIFDPSLIDSEWPGVLLGGVLLSKECVWRLRPEPIHNRRPTTEDPSLIPTNNIDADINHGARLGSNPSSNVQGEYGQGRHQAPRGGHGPTIVPEETEDTISAYDHTATVALIMDCAFVVWSRMHRAKES